VLCAQADPRPAFHTRVEMRAPGRGSIVLESEHVPSATNPRTSADVALSVLRSLRALCASIYVGT
jgi:predicted dinucleotide-utilizing enzyme